MGEEDSCGNVTEIEEQEDVVMNATTEESVRKYCNRVSVNAYRQADDGRPNKQTKCQTLPNTMQHYSDWG